jgi:hypothetical protein
MNAGIVSYAKTSAMVDFMIDVFRVCPDGRVQWLESSSDLENAKARLRSWGTGKYVAFNEET